MMHRLLAISAVLLFSAADAWACSCTTPAPFPCQRFSGSEIVFVGTVLEIENPPGEEPELGDMGWARYRFGVDEWIAGQGGTEIDIYSGRGGADCSFHFKQDEQYLVFPYHNKQDGRHYAGICSDTRHIRYADALLPQLRALRDGKEVASVYGILRKTQQPYASVYQEGYDQFLAKTAVQLRSRDRYFEAWTDEKGAFAFHGVPAGFYTWSASLPAGLEVAQTILSKPPPPIELPAGACYEHNLDALPTGRIRGRVLGPDGKPVRSAFVDLFRVERYKDRETFYTSERWWEYQEEEGFFEFLHVAPGEYILVFNSDDKLDPDAPFPRTFYPNAHDLETAERIVLGDGEQFLNADIRLQGGRPTRELTVRIQQEPGAHDDSVVWLEVRGSQGDTPFASEVAPGVYRVALLRDSRYTIHASCDCGMIWKGATGYPAGTASTEPLRVDGADDRTTTITLVFPANNCGEIRKRKLEELKNAPPQEQ